MSKFNLVRSFSLEIDQLEHAAFKQCIRLPDGRFVALINLDSKFAFGGPIAILFLDKSMKTVESIIERRSFQSLLYLPRQHCILLSCSAPDVGFYCLDIDSYDRSGSLVFPEAGDDSEDNFLPYLSKLETSYGDNMTPELVNTITFNGSENLVLHPHDGSIWFNVSETKTRHIFALSPDLKKITFKLRIGWESVYHNIINLSFLKDGRLVVTQGAYMKVYACDLSEQSSTRLGTYECTAACALVKNKMLITTNFGHYTDLYTLNCDDLSKQKLDPTETFALFHANLDIRAVMQLPDSLDILATTPRQIHVIELEDVAKMRNIQQMKRSRQSWFGDAGMPDDLNPIVDTFLNPPYTFDDEPHEQGGAGAASGAGGAEAKRMKLGNRLLHLELKM